MSSYVQPVLSLLPYHLFSYGALFGFQVYQSFINTRLCYKLLPTPQFRHLSRHIFPVYFLSTSALSVLTALTHPPYSVASLITSPSSYVPLLVSFAAASLNYAILGQQTSEAMRRKSVQEFEDRKTKETQNGSSEEAARVNKRFRVAHASVVHVNAIGLVAVIVYGFVLAGNLGTKGSEA